MEKWKKLSIHVIGITLITLVGLCAISQAKHVSHPHKWFLVLALLMGASFVFESIVNVRRRVVTHYKVFSLMSLVGFLSIIALDSSINSYIYFLALVSLNFFAVKAAYVQFVMHSFELSPASSRYQLDLDCFIQSKQQDKAFEAKILDISNTGCLIDCTKGLRPGEVIYLNIPLHGKEVKTSARVIRFSRNPRGYGLQFVGIDRRIYSNFDEALKDILVDSGTIPYAA